MCPCVELGTSGGFAAPRLETHPGEQRRWERGETKPSTQGASKEHPDPPPKALQFLAVP